MEAEKWIKRKGCAERVDKLKKWRLRAAARNGWRRFDWTAKGKGKDPRDV